MQKLRFPIALKLSILIFALVAGTALAINAVYVRGINRILVERSLHDLEQESEFFQYPLTATLNEIKQSARLLAHAPTTYGFMRAHMNGGFDQKEGATEKQLGDRLTGLFAEMLRTSPNYVRVRLIGVADGGKELARVARVDGTMQRAQPHEFLRLGEHPIIRNTLSLAPDAVFISPVQLDRENGELIKPYRLVVRAGTPVYTEDRQLFGLILLIADFGSLLETMKQQIPSRSTLFITNAAGDFLVHSDPRALYATDLQHDERIQEDYPTIMQTLVDRRQTKVTLLPDDTSTGNVLTFRKYFYDPENPSSYLGIAVQAPYRSIVGRAQEVARSGLILSAAIALAGFVLSILFLRWLIRPLNRIAEAVVRYRNGDNTVVLPVNRPDEIGVLANEFQSLVRQRNEEDWVKGNLAAISNEILGIRDLGIFATVLMQYAATAANAQVGVFYGADALRGREADRRDDALCFLGAYGHVPADRFPQSFRLGEGLVGQCARDRRPLLVSQVPDDYLRITSALGETKPRHILLLPVMFEDRLMGVMELGSLEPFSPIQRALLDQLTFTVGVLLSGIAASMRTEELLEEVRRTAQELQRNEEELKTQQEELQTSNEELEEKTEALEEQNAQIRRQSELVAEQQRRLEDKARELEMASRYKSEFLANMSHELRTPLNSLLILARSLAGNEEGNLTEEQVEEARVIHNGGLELLTLINDILDLSKVEAGRMTVVPEDTPVSGIVKRMRQSFEPVAREQGLAFEVEVEDGVPALIHTDAQRAEQILKNLLSNAFKFTRQGSVTLKIGRAAAGRPQATGKPGIAFAVIDTGIGIEAGRLRDIFEAFRQEDGSIDRHYGGTGLGLTIARKFAHLLGGEIQVESEKGKGSAFTLHLPVTLEVRREEPLPAAAPPAAKPLRRFPLKEMEKPPLAEFIPDDRHVLGAHDKVLLIIEDDRQFAQIMMRMARQHGYKCLAAGDGRNGLFLAMEHPISAIVLDLNLPDIDGITVLDHLKNDLRTRHIPVHIVSAHDEGRDAPLRKGAIGYLAKPADKEAVDGLFTRIETLLQADVKRVLIIEDDRENQLAIQKLLGKRDLELTLTGTGGEGCEALRHTRFDCVILDLQLPDMTGFEWLERMEKQCTPDPPPVIVYTARELSEAENRELSRYTGSIVIKGARSPERLLDEVTLFLHSVGSALPQDQQDMLRMQHNPDKMLEGRTVLLADDDLRNTFALSKLLKKHGLTVIIADNGQMALEKLEEHEGIELVIMDIMMPVMDGYQAMQEIRTRKSRRALPIIALTARAMPEEQEKCIAAGANDYLSKPVDIERLLMLLRVWLFKQDIAA